MSYISHNRPLLVTDRASFSGMGGVFRDGTPKTLRPGQLWTPPRLRRVTHDGMVTLDQATIDSAGAFFINELERLDPTMHDPLVAVFWPRDIQLREDVTIADELSSFSLNNYAAPGGITPGGKAWIGKDVNAIASIALDIGKVANPLFLWGMEMSYTIPELASAAKLGRPLDTTKYNGIKLKHQMDIDEQVYIGDSSLGYYGLTNNPNVYTTNVAAGAGGGGTVLTWSGKTADEVLTDFNTALTSAWSATGWAIVPSEVRLPPNKYAFLVNTKVSQAGNMSLLSYIYENNITKNQGRALNIQPLKWLIGRGAGGTDRMLVYTNDKDYVRFPMTPLQRTNPEQRSIAQITTYFCRLGVVEIVYPETMAYVDGF